MSNEGGNILTKKDFNQFFFRNIISSQICQNYETMQSCCVIYCMGPALEKIYGDDQELLKEKFRSHFQFFNCQTYFGGAILGAALAIEESKQPDATEIATAIKTSLMGPMAGIGDAVFNTLPKVIFAAMASYAAIEGSAVTAILLTLVVSPIFFFIRYKMTEIGYKEGTKIITERQDQLNNLREAISVLGIMIVGALIASNVKITTPIVLTVGEAVQPIQEIFDSILPKMLSIVTTALVYFGLRIKKMTTVKMVWLMIIVLFVLASLGIVQ